jgi:hypothetical protein
VNIMPIRKKTIPKAKRNGDADTRARIQTLKLIRQLEAHALGKLELRPTQVSAALGLLKKALPDLGNVSLRADGKKPGKLPGKLVVAWRTSAK